MIYADCAAQYPPREAAINAAAKAVEQWGNPSGVHAAAMRAAEQLFLARKEIAEAIGAQPSEIIFTASGTEADNMAIFSAAHSGAAAGRTRLLVFAAEHSAVLQAAQAAEQLLGCQVELIPCLANGCIDIDTLERMADGKTALITVMHANNETGVIQPVESIAKIARSCGALFHTDAVQTVGHIPVDVKALGCDMLSMSSHKFGGIAGAGALYCRSNIKFTPLIRGGMQERGRRAGTQALPAICAMSAALREACENMQVEAGRTATLRDRLQALLGDIDGAVAVGADAPRLPGTLCICLPGKNGEQLALLMNRAGVCVSSGAACSTGSNEASHVLAAMGYDKRTAEGALRFSVCSKNTEEEMEEAAQKLKDIIVANS